MATRLAPAVSFHSTGYPGDLKFPGRDENGGTPALLLPHDKGRSGGGEQPGRRSPGGWRSEGGSGYFSRRISIESCEVHGAATPPLIGGG